VVANELLQTLSTIPALFQHNNGDFKWKKTDSEREKKYYELIQEGRKCCN